MPRGRVNPNWINATKEKVRKNKFASATISYNPAAQWLIAYLDQEGIPVKVINLGAGVKKIIVAEKVCSHCGGKGYLK